MKEGNKTSIRKIKYAFICMGLALFLLTLALPAGIVQALQGFEDGSTIPEHYPNEFDQIGRVDRISLDDVVINDCHFKLSPDIQYHTPSIKNASSAWFKEGKFVGYITNLKREIVSLWLIE